MPRFPSFMLFFAPAFRSTFSFHLFQTNSTMLNKYRFAALALLISGVASAQTNALRPLAKVPNLQPVPYQKGATQLEIYTPELETYHDLLPSANNRNVEEMVGMTRWDAQSYGSIAARAYYKPDGQPATTWTHATDGNDLFPERGTGYSARSGGNWLPSNNRIESVRSGFPSSAILSDGTEVVVAHATGFTPFRLIFLRRSPGSTNWTESYLETPSGIGCLWPHLIVGGPDGNTVHLIAITTPVANAGVAYQGVNGHILYWRSLDGGQTWDKKHEIIPGLDNSKFTAHAADEYTIDANGSTVGIAAFPSWNDLLVFKSYDNGDSWETLTARDFPDALENYTGAMGQSYSVEDLGAPDPDAPDSLAILSSDGAGNMLIDANGEVHLFFGRMYYADVDDAEGSVFYPGMNGLMHWKESFGPDAFQIISGALDYDSDGSLNIASINEIAPYYMSLSSMPSSGAGADGALYVSYAAIHELYRSSNDNQQFFRHVYIMKSTDFGETWGPPLDLISAPYIADTVLIPFVECVYPMLPRHFGSTVGLVYQQDYDPGIRLLGPTANGNHPHVDNSLLWIELNPVEIEDAIVSTYVPPTPSLALQLSPNPASDNALLSATLLGEGDAMVEIFDLMGRRVFQQSAPALAGRQTMVLPLQQLNAGNYWVRLTEGKQFGITKLLIAK